MSSQSQPNFLFFITDQHHSRFLGCYDHPQLLTPNIDRLAARGVSFNRFYVASPVCMPNRASLLTGRYPSTHGLRHNGHHLSQRAVTFVDVLRQGGYATALIGKSHVQPMIGAPAVQSIDPNSLGDFKEAWRPDDGDYEQEEPVRYRDLDFYQFKTPYYGFDHVDMVTDHGDRCNGHYYQWLRQKTPHADWLRDRANQLPHNYTCPQAYRTAIPEELYPTSFIRDRAKDYLKSTPKDKPFFAFVSFPDPHHPFTPPGRFWDQYSPADFSVEVPYEAHQNPPPALRWCHQQLINGQRNASTPDAFMATTTEIKEAKALTCGMISMIDEAIGDILATLDEIGRKDNTVIIFTSDHGDYLGQFNLLLKGALPFESITKVPFIWSEPDAPASPHHAGLTSTLDIAPTILDRAGLKPYWGIQGMSLLRLINGTAQRDDLMIEFHDNKPSMGFSAPAFVRTLLGHRYKINVYKGAQWGELYDLHNDPNETLNLWDSQPHRGIKSEMLERLTQQMMSAVDQSPLASRRA